MADANTYSALAILLHLFETCKFSLIDYLKRNLHWQKWKSVIRTNLLPYIYWFVYVKIHVYKYYFMFLFLLMQLF